MTAPHTADYDAMRAGGGGDWRGWQDGIVWFGCWRCIHTQNDIDNRIEDEDNENNEHISPIATYFVISA